MDRSFGDEYLHITHLGKSCLYGAVAFLYWIDDYTSHRYFINEPWVGALRVDETVIPVFFLCTYLLYDVPGRHRHTGITGHLSDVDRHVIREAIEAVGLSHKADTPLAALSDGLRQKAMIARALAQQTPVIIMDEPTAFLDVPSRHALMDLVAELAHRHGRTVLLSTHAMAPALEAGADSVIVVEAGHASMHSADNADEALAALYADDGITYDPDAYDFRPVK